MNEMFAVGPQAKDFTLDQAFKAACAVLMLRELC